MSLRPYQRQLDEKLLIDAARLGDENAFETLYKANLGSIRAAVLAILRSDNDLDDLTQEVFLLAWKNLKTFCEASTFRTWITAIARRHCLAAHKKRKARAGISLQLTPSFELQPWVANQSTDAMVARFELSRLIRGLPLHSRDLVALNLEGFSDREIAKRTQLSVSTVRGRRQRALDTMRKINLLASEQSAIPVSLIYDATNSPEAIPQMGVTASKKKRPAKGKVPKKRVRRPAAAEASPSPVTSEDLFERYIADVERLEHLVAVERRREFEAEVCRGAISRIEALITNFLAERNIDRSREWPVLCRLAKVMSTDPVLQEDCARLQFLPIGEYSRELRLSYVAGGAQHFLPGVVNEVLAVAAKGGQ